ncbi:MAG: thioredoxin-like domain-containing protein [Bacteroidota bacterium]|nr:thioredoxin-like domain-containing protein [Bacteroidota bacterium]
MKALRQTYQPTKAPEIFGDHWFNSEPITIRESQGDLILLFFWDYTSPSSLRLLPLVNEWFHRYSPLGAKFIGIHTPEFSFAKDPNAVSVMLKKYDIQFPVVSDNEKFIANAYRISGSPSIVLVDASGNVYDIAQQTFSTTRLERSIQYLLRQSGFFGELPMLDSLYNEQLNDKLTSEIYTGYLHGSLGNTEGYSPEIPSMYEDPHYYIEGKFYAHGIWRASRNSMVYEGESQDGYLICTSNGSDVDVLIGSDKKKSVRVKIGNEQLPVELMGDDMRRDAKGNSILTTEEEQIVSVVHDQQSENHIIKFIPMNSGITFYMFSFHKEQLRKNVERPISKN